MYLQCIYRVCIYRGKYTKLYSPLAHLHRPALTVAHVTHVTHADYAHHATYSRALPPTVPPPAPNPYRVGALSAAGVPHHPVAQRSAPATLYRWLSPSHCRLRPCRFLPPRLYRGCRSGCAATVARAAAVAIAQRPESAKRRAGSLLGQERPALAIRALARGWGGGAPVYRCTNRMSSTIL